MEAVILESQFAAAKDEASELVSGLRESQFNWRPAREKWSIAECLLHLNIVGDRYVRVIDRALEDAKTRGQAGRNGAIEHNFFERWIMANTEPPPKRMFRTPRSFTPPDGQPITAVLPTFLHLQGQLKLQIEEAHRLKLLHMKIRAPGMGPLRFNLQFSVEWIVAHQRRHLWQARQVRRNPAFPEVSS